MHTEKMIGKFLPLLQDLSNFVDRCYTVATNMVQQLSSLLKDKEHLYRTSFKVRVVCVYDYVCVCISQYPIIIIIIIIIITLPHYYHTNSDLSVSLTHIYTHRTHTHTLLLRL